MAAPEPARSLNAPASPGLLTTLRQLAGSGLGAPALVVMMLAMMVVPLPPLALDALFTFNITLALVVLLATIYVLRPLELGVFPSVLLIATLLRLALNVASTRVVLLYGHQGPGAAGEVIESFGEFVIGGNYAVGLIIFAILMIINFVVVTKGAGRISEVSARFTLDALPGKQMAIDADVNAGLISQEQARHQREEVRQEADFYGAMDGASKFVRGDAIAGVLILFINLIGGLAIGLLQHDLPVTVALENYALLTIGDGLVAQIPSLVLSTAAAMIVTRMSTAEDMGQQVIGQLFDQPKALLVAGTVLMLLGLVPGMPNLIFLTLGGSCVALAQWHRRRRAAAAAAPAAAPTAAAAAEPTGELRDLGWGDLAPVDMLGLEIGYRLIPLVDVQQGGDLMKRIRGVRKKLTQELGFLIPAVHIRDNLELAPASYRISLKGVMLGEAEVLPEREMAIDPGQTVGSLTGIDARDPAFGLRAVWIEPRQREHAQSLGYTVVDAGTVITTHLSHLITQHAHELLGHEEVQQLLDVLARRAPKLVENLIPDTVPLGSVVQVLQQLLAEQVPIRDIRSIAESLAIHGSPSQEPGDLTAAVRAALGRQIVQHISPAAEELPVMTLDPQLEQLLQQGMQAGAGPALEPTLADRLMSAVGEAAQRQQAEGRPAVLLVGPQLRASLARVLRSQIPELHVLAYTEVPDDKQIRLVSTVGQ